MSAPTLDPGDRPSPPPFDRPAVAPPARGGGRGLVVGIVGIGAIAAAAVGIWFAYDQGVKRGAGGAPVLIKADPSPIKTAPENPGGLQIPNQDKAIFEQLASGGKAQPAAKAGPETLLPPPEQPIPQAAQPVAPAAVPPPPVSPALPAATPVAPAPVASLPMPPVPAPAVAAPAVAPAPAPAGGPLASSTPPAAAPQVLTPPTVAPPAPATPDQTTAPAAPPKTAAAAPPPKAATNGTYRVQLGSVKSEAEADKEWRRLKAKFGETLSGAGVRYQHVDLGEKGVWYRIQAGPYASKADADAICARLKSAGQGCSLAQ